MDPAEAIDGEAGGRKKIPVGSRRSLFVPVWFPPVQSFHFG